MAKKKLKNITNKTAKHGFISPMAQYLKYGDWDKSEVASGDLVHRGRTYSEASGTSQGTYGATAFGQGYKAFRYGGKLWKPNPTPGGPAIQKKV